VNDQKLGTAHAREVVRRLCAGLRDALACSCEAGGEAPDPRTEEDMTLLAMWADHAARLTVRQIADMGERCVVEHHRLDGVRLAAADALWSIVHVAVHLDPQDVGHAVGLLAALVPCEETGSAILDHLGCALVLSAMGFGEKMCGCPLRDESLVARLLAVASNPRKRDAEWPKVGITGPGAWGSRDSLRWEFVEGGSVTVSRGGFVSGCIASTPADAREAMLDTARGWKPGVRPLGAWRAA